MARLKITETPTEATGYKIPSSGSLTLPLEIATQQGAGLANLGKAIKEIYQTQKDKEDDTQLIDIVGKVSPELTSIYRTAEQGTNVLAGSEYFRTTIKDTDFLNKYAPDANKQVKDKFNTWLQKYQLEAIPKLTKKITENHLANQAVEIEKNATKLNFERVAAEQGIGQLDFANQRYQLYIDSKTVRDNFTPENYKKFVEEKQLQYIRFIAESQRKKDAPLLIQTIDKFREKLGQQQAENLLTAARAKIISDSAKKLDKSNFDSRADKLQQNAYFAELITRINNANQNPNDLAALNAKPGLDLINDLGQNGSINSEQVKKLFQVYFDKTSLTDTDLAIALFEQISIADTVEKFDLIENAINANPELMQKLGVSDFEKFNKIIKDSNENREGSRQYQFYLKKLTTDMGVVTGITTFNVNAAQQNKLKLLNAQERFTDAVFKEKKTPEQAYLSTIETEKNALPKLEFIEKPKNFNERAITFTKDNYKTGIENLRKELADRVRKEKLNLKDVQKEIAQLSFIEEVADIYNKVSDVGVFFGSGKKLSTDTKDNKEQMKELLRKK